MSVLLPQASPTAFAVRVLGVTPHAAQARYLESTAKVRVAACGRRFGKTTMAAMRRLWFATTRPGTVQLLTAPTADQSKILFSMVVHMARESILADLIEKVVESPFPELTIVVRDAAGAEVRSRIMARSVGHDAKYLRGQGADSVTVDEAAFVPDVVLSQVIPPILATSPYGELDLLSTPFGTAGAFYRTWRQGLEGDPDVEAFHFPSAFNPVVDAAYLARQKADMTALAFRTEYEAEFCDDAAAVFRSEVIRAAIDPDIVAGPARGRNYFIGYDPARYSDRSGVIVLDATQKPWRVVEVRNIAGRDYLTQAALIRELAGLYNEASVLLDATSHDQMLEQLRHDGVRAEGYLFSNTSKKDLVNGLVIALERGDLRLPNDEALIRELTYYRYQTTAAGNVRLGAPEGPGHFDDLVTALGLAVEQARRQASLYDCAMQGQYSWSRPAEEEPERSLEDDAALRRMRTQTIIDELLDLDTAARGPGRW